MDWSPSVRYAEQRQLAFRQAFAQLVDACFQGQFDFRRQELVELAAQLRDLPQQRAADVGIGFFRHEEQRFDDTVIKGESSRTKFRFGLRGMFSTLLPLMSCL